jgi:hypothetical protein
MIKGPKGNPSGGGYRGGGYGRDGFCDDDWNWSSRRMIRTKLDSALSPLISQFKMFEKRRILLENREVTPAMMVATMEILKQKLVIEGHYREHAVTLVDQASVRNFLRDLGDYECRLEIRSAGSGLPMYYLPRVWFDYRSVYSLVLEDLYRSEGYPIGDERFVKIMWAGHEVYFLRLSQFRAALLKDRDSNGESEAQDEVDSQLLKVGRHVFQACWHEDQCVGMAAAGQFDLVDFRRAIELLYLCLSAELCELRSAIDDAMLRFFKDVYDQPAIVAFLGRLAALDGKALAEVPQAALKHFPGLSRAFSRFLAVELPWGRKQAMVPLYKLLFANFSRLDAVREAIAEKEELRQAAESLEKQSQSVIQALLDASGDKGLEPDPALEQHRSGFTTSDHA